MESKQTGDIYEPAPAEIDSCESPGSSPSSLRLTQLDELIELELADGEPDSACTDFLITEERIAREVELLRHKQLSRQLAVWVDEYARVGCREPYLWKWCRQGTEITTLSGVRQDKYDELCDTKVLGVMFDVLLDDVADQKGDVELLEGLLRIPFAANPSNWHNLADEHREYAIFTEVVWKEVERRVKRFPRYVEFEDLLRYDYHQLLNTMRYAHLLNRFPSMLNLAEHDLYLPHNMHMMISATVDLMCSPGFDFDEVGRLREAIWHAQHMGRIGNLVTTWQRELRVGDFTSGVFAHAIIRGDLTIEQLENGDSGAIEKAIREGQHDQYFLRKWQVHRNQLKDLQDSLRSIDLRPLISGLERLICLHLASRGLK